MIRNATTGDIPALIELGTRMYLESRYSQNSPFDADKCAELAQSLIYSPSGCVLVAEKDGQVIGWLGGGDCRAIFLPPVDGLRVWLICRARTPRRQCWPATGSRVY